MARRATLIAVLVGVLAAAIGTARSGAGTAARWLPPPAIVAASRLSAVPPRSLDGSRPRSHARNLTALAAQLGAHLFTPATARRVLPSVRGAQTCLIAGTGCSLIPCVYEVSPAQQVAETVGQVAVAAPAPAPAAATTPAPAAATTPAPAAAPNAPPTLRQGSCRHPGPIRTAAP